MSRTIQELEALSGVQLQEAEVDLDAKSKLNLDRIFKGIAHSMKKNDMRTVSKVARDVLKTGSQSDFDAVIDFIAQMK